MTTYSIIRYHRNGSPRVLRKGLTLEAAQAHCNNPLTSSSSTSRNQSGKGDWFDGFREEKPQGPRRVGLLETAFAVVSAQKGNPLRVLP